jgi:hypothetical protein
MVLLWDNSANLRLEILGDRQQIDLWDSRLIAWSRERRERVNWLRQGCECFTWGKYAVHFLNSEAGKSVIVAKWRRRRELV